MELRNLGKSGLRLTAIGLGANNFAARMPEEMTKKTIDAVFELGINFIDTADVYGNRGGSEELLGKYLGARRKDIVLASKFAFPMDEEGKLKGASRVYIMRAVENSLRRLNTDWIDLYQIHRYDPETPIEETLRALDDLVHQGKVRYIGHSAFDAWQVSDAGWTSRHHRYASCVSGQWEYSILSRGIEREIIPACEAHGVGLLPFYPLAGGLLTGKYKRGVAAPSGTRLANAQSASRMIKEKNWPIIEGLEKFSAERGHTLLELAINWLLAQRSVSCVMAGATSPEQLAQNAKAADWKLSQDDLAEIDKITLKS